MAVVCPHFTLTSQKKRNWQLLLIPQTSLKSSKIVANDWRFYAEIYTGILLYLRKNIGIVLGTYFGMLIIFQIVIKIARVLTGIIICPVFILIYHVQPSNFSSAFGNVNLNANCKILRTAFFCRPHVFIFLGNLFAKLIFFIIFYISVFDTK